MTAHTPRFRFFPISFEVADKPVLVAGEGEQALQKLRLLVRTKARLTLCAADPSAELIGFAQSNGIQIVPDEPCECRIRGAALLFLATGDEANDARLAARVRAIGVPVNVVDRPHLSDFATPAIVDRAPISIAIATDGHAPMLAVRLRGMIEALVAPSFGRLAQLAETLRGDVLARFHEAGPRRRFWERLFDGRAGALARDGETARAAMVARAQLDLAEPPVTGHVSLIGAGPGAEDLLTLRAQRALLRADVIVHDGLVPEAVIAMGRRDAERISVGKRKGRHSVSQGEIDALLVRLAKSGKRVARLKSGDPMVFGRAGEEIAALRAAGISFDIVPGVTAALAAAADLALPLSLRDVASQIVFATGHGADGADASGIEALAAMGATVALYMGRTVADDATQRLIAAGLAPSTPAVAIEHAGRTTRRVFAGTLAELPGIAARDDLEGPALILIGPAIAHADLSGAEPFAIPYLSQAA